MAKDILLDDTYNLQIQDGDFVIGDSQGQEVEQILMSAPGQWRQNPTIGFNIVRFAKAPSSESERFVKELVKHLQLDGKQDIEIDVSNGFMKPTIKLT